ncbi:MAG: hypothetical protein ACXV5U_09840 [Ilumatobacteraceae bacterium]
MRGVLAIGMLAVLVGFALMVPRGGVAGSVSARNVMLGNQRVSTRGYAGTPSRRSRVIQVLIGLVLLVIGILLIASSG